MKAISIRQPWCFAILHLGKDIENRPQPWAHRGPILIHASKTMTGIEYQDALASILTITDGHRGLDSAPLSAVPKLGELPRGGIVGIVDVVCCVRESASPWFFGKWGLILQNARPLPFIPYSGQLGRFEVPDALLPPEAFAA